MLSIPIQTGVIAVAATQKMADVSGTAQLVAFWLHGKSKASQRSYESNIRCFVAFLLVQKPDEVRLNDLGLRTITMNDVQAYCDYLETVISSSTGNPLSTDIRKRRTLAVKSLLRFGHEVEYLRYNATIKIKAPKPRQTLAERILSEMEVMTMIALTLPGRDHSLIKFIFIYYTGARVGEVARLTWRDIRLNRDGQGQVTLFGKGQETKTVIIPKDLYKELQSLNDDHSPNAAVFISRKGQKPLGDRHIREIVNNAGVRAGIKGVSPHWLRHSHASHHWIGVRLLNWYNIRWDINLWILQVAMPMRNRMIAVDCI
ncbi:MAG: tyrosine-type recombinase/integrase [Nostoc desertorum CM1-VF14]|jgi:integrase/recombinase XerD|nr:tyrosine-type recombinase/integrase [Nostoc desertorum CM1-VF14]